MGQNVLDPLGNNLETVHCVEIKLAHGVLRRDEKMTFFLPPFDSSPSSIASDFFVKRRHVLCITRGPT
jgi:hypothetical protein